MDSRDYFIIACLILAGTVLRFFLVLFNEPITPNILVAFYGLAIMVVGLSFGQSLILGFLSGSIMALISQSIFNPAFLLSEPVGAVVCLGVFLSLPPSPRRAGFAVFLATLASGIVFSAIGLSLGQIPVADHLHDQLVGFLSLFLIVILITSAINGTISGLLYPKVRNFRNATR